MRSVSSSNDCVRSNSRAQHWSDLSSRRLAGLRADLAEIKQPRTRKECAQLAQRCELVAESLRELSKVLQ